jgi:dihydrolipoamide dehydrogenase
VTLISKEALPGGECLHRGCIPSKALIEAANFFGKIKSAKEIGIIVSDAQVDFPALQQWKESVVNKLVNGMAQLLKQHKIKYLVGEAALTGAHSLDIKTSAGTQRLNFENLIIATGSRSRPLKGFDFDGKSILSSEQALALKEIPKSLLVIGGGYIGLELGEVFSKIGSKVTIVEALTELLPGTDPALVRPLKKKLTILQIDIMLETLAKSFVPGTSGLTVSLEPKDAKPKEIQVEKILVAVGRIPNSEGLGLEKVSVERDNHGFIKINARCQTSLPHIYAIGDVAGGMMLAHKASREGLVAAACIAGEKAAFDNQVPAVIFTDPEIAYVGLSEEQAKAQGIEVVTGMFGFAANGRALTMNDSEGFIRVIAEKSSQRVIGVQMVGPHVSDLISEATLGIEMGATTEDFALTIHPHPTLSEAMMEAMESALGMPIHRYQPKSRSV